MTYDRCHLADGCAGDEACVALCPDQPRRRAVPGTPERIRRMAYDDENTTEGRPTRTLEARDARDLPKPFDPWEDADGDWHDDERQVADWADSASPRFDEAVGALSLTAIRVGIAQAERVANEHRRLAVQADDLVQRLRDAAHSAAEHGREDQPIRASRG